MLQFAIAAVVAVAAVGLGAALLLQQEGIREATRDAEEVMTVVARGIIEPNVTKGLLAGNPADIARLDRIVAARVTDPDSIVRVKIWRPDGTIAYSDEPRLIGERYGLEADDMEILRRGGIKAERTDLGEPENRFDRDFGDLVEVFGRISGPGGQPLLFETYIRSSTLAESAERIWLGLVPLLIGGLVVLAVLQLPLALSVARRLRRGDEERAALLAKALDASQTERRRIAQDLHDGVVQDLAGVSYALAAAVSRARSGGSADSERLDAAARQTRQSLRELRTLVVDIYPPDLHRGGLASALTDLTAVLRSRAITSELSVQDDLDLPPPTEALFYRAAQESVRNVISHSGAERVAIRISGSAEEATLEVEDDGRGFDPAESDAAGGHLGLRVLADLARDAGGELLVHAAPARGTRVTLKVPVTA